MIFNNLLKQLNVFLGVDTNTNNNTNSNRENKTTNNINRRGTAPIKTSDPNEILRQ